MFPFHLTWLHKQCYIVVVRVGGYYNVDNIHLYEFSCLFAKEMQATLKKCSEDFGVESLVHFSV